MKYWKIWQKNSIKAKLPDVSAIVAATALWKHLIMLRNDASSLWAEVLSPLSSCVLYTLRSYSSCLLLLIPAAVRVLSHSSLTEFMGIVLSGGSHTRWRWRRIGNGREWIPNTKLSAPRVCYIVFWKSLFKESHPWLWDVELRKWGREVFAGQNYVRKQLPWMWSENKILSSLPAERNHTSLKTFKAICVSQIYKIPSVQTAVFTILTTRQLILPQAS